MTAPPRSGLGDEALADDIRPQDDLFGYVNGPWIAATPMPDDRARYGAFDMVAERTEDQLRELLETAARDRPVGRPGVAATADDLNGLRAMVGSLYASMLDEPRCDSLGLAPIEADLNVLGAASDVRSLWMELGRLQREGVGGALTAWVATDDRASHRYVVYLHQSGLGLPDESYYREPAYEQVRSQYADHLRNVFGLLGSADPGAEAQAVLDLETRLAAGHWNRVDTRDSMKSYTKLTLAELEAVAPAVPWRVWREALGAPADAFDEIVVRQPSYVQALSTLLEELPIGAWRCWARACVVRAYAPYLHAPLVAEHFDFYQRTLTGAPEQRDRWKRAIKLVGDLVGEAAGRLYVEAHFPPEAKQRMTTLVGHLIEAYRQDIAALTWMGPATREKALAKLDLFTAKIGYPDRWRNHAGLAMRAEDLIGNIRVGSAYEVDRDWAKLGGPIDRTEWLMSPQTVNAYYLSGMNEIVFPAGILQPPFFDLEADDAVNYGAIGAVIGHEIGHGFDDQGSRYDGHGNLVDWWTADDRTAFEALAAKLIAQYDAFRPRVLEGENAAAGADGDLGAADGLDTGGDAADGGNGAEGESADRVNGALTVGENIGDLGGLTIAHLAYRLSLAGRPAPQLDGLSGPQRLFCGWARVWRMQIRPQEARRLLAIDPHAPTEFRANIVRNLLEFYEAFDVREGDGLWLPEAERVRIW